MYVTAGSTSSNPFLSSSLPNLAIINKNQIECYPYSVLNSENDVLYNISNFQGHIDWFVSSVDRPASMLSSYVKMTGKKVSANHNLILKSSDRSYWGSSLGTYYLCGLAYTDASAQISLREQKFSNTYSV